MTIETYMFEYEIKKINERRMSTHTQFIHIKVFLFHLII